MAHRIAIAGLGEAGFTMHLPAAAALDDTIVVGVCDPDPARLARAASRFGVRDYATLSELLATEKPDCIIVATPPDTHTGLCIEALASGCDVLCEKPFTLSVEEADEIIAAAHAAKKSVAINHEFREMPIFRGVLDAIGGNSGDPIVFAQAWQQVNLPPAGETGWRGEMRRRVLQEAGVHLVDFIMAAFGESPTAISATVSDGGLASGSDAIVALTLSFSGGRIGSVVMNRLSKGENQYFDARVDTISASYRASFGGRARLTAGLHRAKNPHIRFDYGVSGLAWKEVGSRREIIARNPADPRVTATRDVISRSLKAFQSGGEPPCSAEWARQVSRVIEAAYRSADSGRVERVERA